MAVSKMGFSEVAKRDETLLWELGKPGAGMGLGFEFHLRHVRSLLRVVQLDLSEKDLGRFGQEIFDACGLAKWILCN